MEFIQALKNRKSVYNINKEVAVEDHTIIDMISDIVLNTPSAYNSESQRVVLLLGEKHDLFWDIVTEEIKKVVQPEDFPKSKEKMDSFKNGYGTVLFFDNFEVTEGLTMKFPLYKKNFLKWAEQQLGMLESNVWVGLESLGLGASLQHYNELVEKRVKEEFSLPDNFVLDAQMPFGNIVEKPSEKKHLGIEERLTILK